MRKILILFFAVSLTFTACKNNTKTLNNYTTLSGKVTNPTDNSFTINGPEFSKEITLDASGNFSDTLKTKEGFYMLRYGTNETFLFLKNSYNIQLDFDAANLKNTISFVGVGAGTNNYMANKIRFEEKEGLSNFNSFFELDKSAFESKVNSIKNSMSNLIDNAVDLDSTFLEH